MQNYSQDDKKKADKFMQHLVEKVTEIQKEYADLPDSLKQELSMRAYHALQIGGIVGLLNWASNGGK